MITTEPLRLSLILKSDLNQSTCIARFRPFPSRGHPDRTGPVVSFPVPAPDHAGWDWFWGGHMAVQGFHVINVPDDYYELPPPSRYQLLMSEVYRISPEGGQPTDRR